MKILLSIQGSKKKRENNLQPQAGFYTVPGTKEITRNS